jgi:hypothetical protein
VLTPGLQPCETHNHVRAVQCNSHALQSCLLRPSPHGCVCEHAGISNGALAAAIAVPVGVVLLAGGLLAAYCLRRRRRRQQQHQKQGLLAPHVIAPAGAAAARDLEAGPDSGAGRDALLAREADQVSCQAWLGLVLHSLAMHNPFF